MARKKYQKLVIDANELMEQGKHEQAIAMAEQAMQAVKAEVGEAHKDASYVQVILSMTLVAAGRFDRAKEVLRRNMEADERLHGPGSEHVAMDLLKLGELHLKLKEAMDAEAALSKAIQILEGAQPEDNVVLANCYYDLGEMKHSNGQREEAAPLLEKAVAILKHHKDDRGMVLIHSYMMLYDTAMAARAFERAEGLAREALSDEKWCVGTPKDMVVTLGSMLGEAEWRLGHLKQAAKAFETAYYDGRYRLRGEDLSYFRCLHRDWEMRRALGDVEGELMVVGWAMSQLKHLGKLDTDLALRWRQAKALSQLDKGDLAAAIATLTEAVKAAEAKGGVAPTDVGEARIELGRLLHLFGDLDGAERLMEEGRDAFDAHHHYGYDLELVPYYRYKVELLLERELIDEAESASSDYSGAVMLNLLYVERAPERAQQELYDSYIIRRRPGIDSLSSGRLEVKCRMALEEAQASFTEWHPAVAPHIRELARVMARSGQHDAALAMLSRGRAALETAVGKDHPDVYELLLTRAEVEEGRGDRAGARRSLDEAVQLAHRRWGARSPALAEAHLRTALLCFAAGDLAWADQAADQAFQSEPTLPGAVSTRVARIFRVKASIMGGKGNLTGAANFLGRAQEIYSRVYGRDHRLARETEIALSRLGGRPPGGTSEGVPIGGEGAEGAPPALRPGQFFRQTVPRLIKVRRLAIAGSPLQEFASTNKEERAAALARAGMVEEAISHLTTVQDGLEERAFLGSLPGAVGPAERTSIADEWARAARALGLLHLSRGDRWSAGKQFALALRQFGKSLADRNAECLRTYHWLSLAIDGWEEGCDGTDRSIREKAAIAIISGDEGHIQSIKEMGDGARREGRLPEAARLLRAAAELYDIRDSDLMRGNVGPWVAYSEVLLELGDLEESARVLATPLRRWEASNHGLKGFPREGAICKARVDLGSGRPEAAVKLLEMWTADNGIDAGSPVYDVVLLLADSYLAAGERSKAKSALEQLKKQLSKWDRTVRPDERTKAHFKELLARMYDERDGAAPD